MPGVSMTRHEFQQDRQGRTFADVLNDPEQPLDAVLAFFNDADRQRRMEEAEIHHDRAPLAGVVRELEMQPAINEFLASQHPRRTKRLRQAVGVVVRIVMERLGWQKTGKKGSLGVRAKVAPHTATPGAYHNTGGLAFWFLRAERYARPAGMPFPSVKQRVEKLTASPPSPSAATGQNVGLGASTPNTNGGFMARDRNTFEKRQRETKKKQKAQEKRVRRQQRKDEPSAAPTDPTDPMDSSAPDNDPDPGT